MAKKWADVAANPAFQSLSAAEQEEVRNLYFDEVVAPQVPEESLAEVRSLFDADTRIAKRDLPAGVEPSRAGGGRGSVNPPLASEPQPQRRQQGFSLPKPIDPMGIASGKPLGDTPISNEPAASPAQEIQPKPYRDRREALDDAVNLLEEGAPKEKVADAFGKAGIPFNEIVKHGQKRGSEYFKQQPGLTQAEAETARLGQRFPDKNKPQPEIKARETGLIEDTVNFGKRVAARGQQSFTGLLANVNVLDPEGTAALLAKQEKKLQAAAPPPSIVEGMEKIGRSKTLGEAAAALMQNPAATATMLAESVLLTAPALAATFMRAPAVAMGAGVGGYSGALEYGGALSEALNERGISLLDAPAVAKALQDKAFMDAVREKGATRGLTIGTIDALTAGIAGRFIRPAQEAIAAGKLAGSEATRATIGGWAKELSVQVAGGSGGEALAQGLTGEYKPADILLEGLGEGVSAPFEAASNLREAKYLDPMQQVASAIDGVSFTKSGIIDSVQQELTGQRITIPATPMADFTGDNSPTVAAGLPRIMVPVDNVVPGEDLQTTDGQPTTVDGTLPAVGAGLVTPRTQLAERTSDADLLARAEQQTAEQPKAEAQQVWFGRRGDGYQTQPDAEQALPGRQRMFPDLKWGVEPMANGKFRLAGYKAMEQAPATQASTTTENAPSAPPAQPAAPSVQLAGRDWVKADPQTRSTATQVTFAKGELGAVKVSERKALAAEFDQQEMDDGSTVFTRRMAAPAAPAVAGPAAQQPAPAATGVATPAISRDAVKLVLDNLNRPVSVPQPDGTTVSQRLNFTTADPGDSEQATISQRIASAFGRPIMFVKEAQDRAGFNAQLYPNLGVIAANVDSDRPLFAVTTHEVYHGLPEDLRKATTKAVMETVTPEQRERFLNEFSAYKGAESELQDEELVSRIIEQDAEKPEFWQAIAKRMGDGEFGRLAREIITMLDKLLAKFSPEDSSEFTSDIKRVREIVADAYAQAQARLGQPVDSAVAESSRRKREQVGDYEVIPEKDGSFTALGSADEIRAAMPEGVVGRVVDGGVKFTASDAPRARAALEGRKLAYSRAGQVVDKLPMKDGKYLGAPPGFDTPAKIPTLRKLLMKLTKEGERGRYWYENSSKAVLRMAGSVEEARRFVALLAIYSPQAKVDTNTTFALRAWAQYKAGQPISVKTRVMDQKATDAMRDVDAFWSGEKTGNFFNNLLREIDPSTAGKQGATIDMWMMRAGMYPTDAPTKTQYAFMENETNRIASELGWEPQQVQAAIWVAMKARMENAGVKKRTEATSEKKGWLRYIENGKGQKVRDVLDKQKHRDNWLKHAMDHEPTAADTQAAKFDFEDGLMRHIGQISFESRPGRSTGVLPGIHDAPYAQQVEFHQAVQRALYDERGVDMLATRLGLLVDSDILAPGVWQGEVSPSTQLSVTMAPNSGAIAKNEVDPAQAKALNVYASVLGLLTRQEGVGWHRPFYATTKREANGVEIDIGRPLNPTEAADLEKVVDRWMQNNGKSSWRDQFAFISSPKGIRLVNFGTITNGILQSEIIDLAGQVLTDGKARMFASSGGMLTNNWKESPDGQDYVGRIRAEGRSDVLDWAAGVLAPRVQGVFTEFAETYGWGEPGRIVFSARRDGQGSGRSADRQVPAPERAAEEALTALPGAPSVPGFSGPDPRLVAVAEEYARSIGITLRRQSEYVQVDEARARRIAQAYEAMPHAPQDPQVREAYENLIRQTTEQYRALERAGYKFWFMDLEREDNQQYASSPWNAMRDIRANQQMGVFPTEEGFGTDAEFDPSSNPLLADTGIQWPSGSVDGPMKRVLANDLFRAVHDAFGHGLEGSGFRAQGEENAWQAHVRLFTGSAVGAITSETRGQNSWLNYGPYGERNRNAKVEDTVFADQKTGLMPEWTWTEGRAGDMPMASARRDIGAELQARVDNEFDALVEEYAGLPKTDGGRIIDADLARELSPEYRADRTRAAEVHEAVSDFTTKLFAKRLLEQKPGAMVFMAGGGGAGKSSADYLVGRELAKANTIVDGTLSSPDKARAMVLAALRAGHEVRVVYVYRDPVDAFVNGVIPRAISTGRTVPLDALVKGHVGAARTVRELQREFAGDRRFTMTVVDNTRGEGEARLSDLASITNVVESGLKERFQDEARRRVDRGVLPRSIYEATVAPATDTGGTVEGAARRGGDGSGAGGALPQGRESERAGNPVIQSARRSKLGFYSELAAQLEKGPGQAPADQWRAFLKGLPGKGVKVDEIEWSGIEDWLTLQTGKVKKQDVLNYLEDNGTQVEETVLAGAGYFKDADEAIAYLAERYGKTEAEIIDEYGYNDRSDYIELAQSVVDDRGDQTQYGKYTLPGGENYREVLLTLPELPIDTTGWTATAAEGDLASGPIWVVRDQNNRRVLGVPKENEPTADGAIRRAARMERSNPGNYKSSHWAQPNIVAHIRLNDRTDTDGKRVLFVEELQSDWGQAGQKKMPDGTKVGFKKAGDKPYQKLVQPGEWDAFNERVRNAAAEVASERTGMPASEMREAMRSIGMDRLADMAGMQAEWRDLMDRLNADLAAERAGMDNRPPAAPFVTKTEGWLNLGLKRVLTMAVEEGYDSVAFVNGEQSAARYDLSKQVQSLSYEPDGKGSGRLRAWSPDRSEVMDQDVPVEKLEDYIGKEVAKKLLETKPVMGKHLLDGEQLKVGGQGMRAFYDTIVPNATRALLKKLGGQMRVIDLGERLDARAALARRLIGEVRTEAGKSNENRPTQQPGFDITDAMREKVGAGLPLFSARRTPQTETPEFKAWFGDSKAVEAVNAENGRPLTSSKEPKKMVPQVMYHTTRNNFNEFEIGRITINSGTFGDWETSRSAVFVTPELQASETYGKRDGRFAEGANVMPLYIKAENPLDLTAGFIPQNVADQFDGIGFSSRWLWQFDWSKFDGEEGKDFVDAARRLGYDSVIFNDENPDTGESFEAWALFDPTQIKSATGNRGTFDANDPDIRMSARRQPINGQRFNLPGEGKWMAARRAMQDYFIRVREVQDALITQGGKVGEAQNVYRAEELMYGRVQEQMLDFANRVVKPMVERAGTAGIDMDELALFAYAMHAKERNADIARKNQRFPDGGSGMTDAQADGILAKFKADGKEAALRAAHADLMSMTQATRIVLLDEGLISQEQFDAMQAQYTNYVPLRGFEQVDDDGKRVLRTAGGKGFNIRGAETMKALGRESRAGNIIENIINDYERAVVRAERNNVGKVFLDLVTTNPDPDLWEIDAVKVSSSLDRSSGQVVTKTSIDKGENTIAVKVGGREVYVRINDPLLLRAMRNAYRDDTGTVPRWLANTLGVYTNWMRNVLTRYNVAFSAVNATRDVQAGAVAALDELGPEGVKLYGKYYGQAMAASFRNETNRLDQSARTSDRFFEEFRAAGGTTGGFFMRDAEEIKAELRGVLVAAGAAPRGLGEKVKASMPGRGVVNFLRALEILGSTSENAARAAAYRAARELGRSPSEAASIAKNLTTNFNRKGEWGHLANSLYLFFNAAVQGSARVLKALKSRRVQHLMAGTTATAMGLAFMAAGMGDDDDGEAYWDKIPEFEKERNLIIMLPPGMEMDGAAQVGTRGRYIKIPMPYGFNVFPVLGYQLADLMRYAQDRNRGAAPGKAAVRMVSAIAGSYNPLGGAVDVADPIKLGMALSPTAGDLFIQLSAGVNPFGDPVGQFKSPYDQRPDSEIAGPKQAGSASQSIARWLNEVTGGNAGRSGAIDVQPATIENLGRTFGGGAGDFLWSVFVNLPAKALTPEAEIKGREIPIYKAFVGSVDGDTDVRKFYERRAEVLEEFKAAKREQDLGVAVKYDEKSRALQSLGAAAESVTKQMSGLRKEEVRIADDQTMTPAEKTLQRRALEKERQALALEFNRQYVQTMRGGRNEQP